MSTPLKPSNNDVILLNQILAKTAPTWPSGASTDEAFNYMVVEQRLKNYDLSFDELLAGLTDGNGDGGIDGFYTFADENLMDEDSDTSSLPTRYSLDVFILQGKTGSGFKADPLNKLIVSIPMLLSLNIEPDTTLFSALLIQRVNIFRSILQTTARKFPSINIHVVYACKGSIDRIDAKVQATAKELEAKSDSIVGSGTKTTVTFLGARQLLDLARAVPSSVVELPYQSIASRPNRNSYVALVPIRDYAQFITDGAGKLNKFIFESNVRDFQGPNNQVNKGIRETLGETNTPASPDFWWLNNGVTILCDHVENRSGKFVIKDPQIVNGLQTSVEIYNHFKQQQTIQAPPEEEKDNRSLLVKVIETNDDPVRRSVIVATNSQTNLLPTAIYAGDSIQHDIDEYFLSQGYFYDRRKNFYKNLGKPADLIFTVPYLAQSVLAIGFSEPDQARARPSTVLRKEEERQKIFNSHLSMSSYLWMARLQQRVDKFIRQADATSDFKTNMRFYISMMSGWQLLSGVVYHPAQLIPYFETEVSDQQLQSLVAELKVSLEDFMRSNPDYTIDRAAKSKEFRKYLIASAVQAYS